MLTWLKLELRSPKAPNRVEQTKQNAGGGGGINLLGLVGIHTPTLFLIEWFSHSINGQGSGQWTVWAANRIWRRLGADSQGQDMNGMIYCHSNTFLVWLHRNKQ
jgi:hypothetical protein